MTTPVPHHSVFTGRMPFLAPNQQRQSTEGTTLQLKNFEISQVSIGTCFDIICQWLHRRYQQEKTMLFVISVLEILHSFQLCIGNNWEHTTHVHFSYTNKARQSMIHTVDFASGCVILWRNLASHCG